MTPAAQYDISVLPLIPSDADIQSLHGYLRGPSCRNGISDNVTSVFGADIAMGRLREAHFVMRSNRPVSPASFDQQYIDARLMSNETSAPGLPRSWSTPMLAKRSQTELVRPMRSRAQAKGKRRGAPASHELEAESVMQTTPKRSARRSRSLSNLFSRAKQRTPTSDSMPQGGAKTSTPLSASRFGALDLTRFTPRSESSMSLPRTRTTSNSVADLRMASGNASTSTLSEALQHKPSKYTASPAGSTSVNYFANDLVPSPTSSVMYDGSASLFSLSSVALRSGSVGSTEASASAYRVSVASPTRPKIAIPLPEVDGGLKPLRGERSNSIVSSLPQRSPYSSTHDTLRGSLEQKQSTPVAMAMSTISAASSPTSPALDVPPQKSSSISPSVSGMSVGGVSMPSSASSFSNSNKPLPVEATSDTTPAERTAASTAASTALSTPFVQIDNAFQTMIHVSDTPSPSHYAPAPLRAMSGETQSADEMDAALLCSPASATDTFLSVLQDTDDEYGRSSVLSQDRDSQVNVQGVAMSSPASGVGWLKETQSVRSVLGSALGSPNMGSTAHASPRLASPLSPAHASPLPPSPVPSFSTNSPQLSRISPPMPSPTMHRTVPLSSPTVFKSLSPFYANVPNTQRAPRKADRAPRNEASLSTAPSSAKLPALPAHTYTTTTEPLHTTLSTPPATISSTRVAPSPDAPPLQPPVHTTKALPFLPDSAASASPPAAFQDTLQEFATQQESLMSNIETSRAEIWELWRNIREFREALQNDAGMVLEEKTLSSKSDRYERIRESIASADHMDRRLTALLHAPNDPSHGTPAPMAHARDSASSLGDPLDFSYYESA
ncbi:hypothetical protein MVES1_003150 [Malassezia vespertilionis]|uniref:Uncharacterized protein n=1 Tax=Malassezia vespertilionis TaxID=2020962 RepID=A0A2N1J9G7_9BASI|nr:uncharacterized protein MVES1_003150 [Malassezia vespertilionis]PKI83184.1 hypothetical protein MVES_002990 [Malassezia vespertilionis]WFD07779.1 hypothetical protein MVES1_003150 [Malassezia vespertilionis]